MSKLRNRTPEELKLLQDVLTVQVGRRSACELLDLLHVTWQPEGLSHFIQMPNAEQIELRCVRCKRKFIKKASAKTVTICQHCLSALARKNGALGGKARWQKDGR